ncbi:MAG: Rieske 2Fe-2S domain-containing protein [Candidatus Wallbacteria bacterium]|nr:Rieske 2Fe-2S domain-containing protein [Candidatus Wallbacteria bacterium]
MLHRLDGILAEMRRRREAMAALGWSAIAAYVGIYTLALVRFFFPRVLFEPSNVFRAGYPSEFTVGTVDTKYQKSQRVWIVREPDGFYALLAKCTHLGCTPVWKEAENKFKCPCHGSGFTKEGINYEGPAPRPLERCKITLADDGQLQVDKSIVFRQDKGEWEKPGAVLKA